MNFRFILLLIVIFPLLLKSEYSWESSSAKLLVQNGVYALYNYQFYDAIEWLDSARTIDSSHPLPAFVLISAKWLKTQTEEGYDASYKIINAEVEKTIPLYKQLMKENPDDPEIVLYLGSTYGLRARTAMASKEWLDVLYFGYRGLKFIREAKHMDRDLLDVYMPIGLMEYFACLSPTPIKWGAALIGLSSDCEKGIAHLEIAAKHSNYSWIEASNVLTYIYLHIERDYNKAEEVISPLVTQFPGHPYFALLEGELLAKKKKWDKLEYIMPKLEEFSSSGSLFQQNECQLKIAYIRGLTAFFQENYQESIKEMDWLISNYHMEFDWLKGFAHMLRGKSYDILSIRESAIKDYAEVLKMDEYYPEVNEARSYLEKPYIVNN